MDKCYNISTKFHALGLESFSIEKRKAMAKTQSKIRNSIIDKKCLLCQSDVDSLCNSHFIPEFILKKIDDNGMLLQSSSVVDLPEQFVDLKKSVGVATAGTFMLICRECDKQIFMDYENPENYDKIPNQKMLLQLALKNYLKYFSKRKIESKTSELCYKKALELGFERSILDYYMHKKKGELLDIVEYKKMITKLYGKLKKNKNDIFDLFYFKRLNYVVPLASQTQIVLIGGLNNEIINNVYNYSSRYHLKELHLFIFPMETYSVVGMFYNVEDKRYKNFIFGFNKLSEEDKLQTVNYILLRYSEDYFLSPRIDNDIKDKIKDIVDKGAEIKKSDKMIQNALIDHSLNNRFNIPNLLDKKYAIG